MTELSELEAPVRTAIAELLADPIFEMIPMKNALEQARHLSPGSRISVTASPNKTLDDSLDLAGDLVDMGFRVTPHLSARMTRGFDHLAHLLERIDRLGITTAFVVGGDPEPAGPFDDGLSLLEAMEEIGHSLEVGVPCYPEGHAVIPDDALDEALQRKQRHATWMTSQMCFDGEAVMRWTESSRQAGISLPLVLGLPGVADRMKLLRISTRIGVGRSLSFLRKNTGLVSAFVKPGGYDPAELLIDMGPGLLDPAVDVTGCHIYTFNQCDTTEAWRQSVLEALGDG